MSIKRGVTDNVAIQNIGVLVEHVKDVFLNRQRLSKSWGPKKRKELILTKSSKRPVSYTHLDVYKRQV